jgi:uncharacterized membrane protein HdeD (DUF308 family)
LADPPAARRDRAGTTILLQGGRVNESKKKLSGILFIIAGMIFMFAATAGIKTTFFVLACAFVAIGAAMLRKAKKEGTDQK